MEFLYLYVCMSGLFNGVKVSAKLSIQVNAILETIFSMRFPKHLYAKVGSFLLVFL